MADICYTGLLETVPLCRLLRTSFGILGFRSSLGAVCEEAVRLNVRCTHVRVHLQFAAITKSRVKEKEVGQDASNLYICLMLGRKQRGLDLKEAGKLKPKHQAESIDFPPQPP